MKKYIVYLILAITGIISSSGSSKKGTWTMDKNHSRLGFTTTHLLVSDVDGVFKTFNAKITTPSGDFSNAIVEMTAEAKSIDTGNEMRDKDLKSENFFDAEKYNMITFKSKTFKKVKENSYKVTGDLTMHGVTKTLELDALCRMGKNPQNQKPVAGFKITGVLSRKDYNIGNSTPSAIVSDEVRLVANAEFSQE